MPRSVSGVTAAPSEMPTVTNTTRASGAGICIGRCARAATATAIIEPDSQPAGNPNQANSARAITVLGTTALIRPWRWNGREWVE